MIATEENKNPTRIILTVIYKTKILISPELEEYLHKEYAHAYSKEINDAVVCLTFVYHPIGIAVLDHLEKFHSAAPVHYVSKSVSCFYDGLHPQPEED